MATGHRLTANVITAGGAKRSQGLGRCRGVWGAFLVVLFIAAAGAGAQPAPPALTEPVNDFAHVIDDDSRRAMEALIRSLQQASGDVVVVATVDTVAPYADINEYAVKMFANGGRGIGQRGKDNGVLIVAAINDRRVKVEVGYDLEQFVTDGFAGQVIREELAPEFRNGAYGPGLLAGVSRIIGRIADGRNITLQGVRPSRRRAPSTGSGSGLIIALFVLFMVINAIAGLFRRRRGYRRWGGGPWSGWSSGVGPFGGGWGGGGGFGGGGGGGFGGGFGGFGGGRSGGGGASGGW
jgi:uncharacterized protein